jgi:hypothetical protein
MVDNFSVLLTQLPTDGEKSGAREECGLVDSGILARPCSMLNALLPYALHFLRRPTSPELSYPTAFGPLSPNLTGE